MHTDHLNETNCSDFFLDCFLLKLASWVVLPFHQVSEMCFGLLIVNEKVSVKVQGYFEISYAL
jgi:hypothetical protein